jgi:signal peptide peptidase SppA
VSRAHLLALMQEPMALELRAFKALTEALARDDSTALEIAADSPLRAARKTPASSFGGNVAVIGVYGFLTSRPNVMEWLFPACCTSTQSISSQLRAALADDSIGCVIFDFDSPGGGVYGASELADEIFAARAVKPVLGISDHLAASAAFWLASQCTNFYVSPSSETGSIGVLTLHENWAENNKMIGREPSYVSAGVFKTEANPDMPLGDDARSYIQTRIDDYYDSFTRAIARGRATNVATVVRKMGQGRVLGAQDAVAANLACGIKTFQQVVDQARIVARNGGKTRASALSTQALRDELAALQKSTRTAAEMRRYIDVDEELSARRSAEHEARMSALGPRTLTPEEARARIASLK